ncbi:hypothetical protein SRHO_G00006920 [Serrasalmus rhombeus]
MHLGTPHEYNCQLYTKQSLIMSFTVEEIRQAILSVLPSLPEQTLSSLLEKLVSTGVECKSDLKLIKEEDLQELLRPIQCCKLLQAWSSEEEITRVTDLQSETSSSSRVDISSPSFRNSSSASSTPSPASKNSRSSTVDLDTWPVSFKVPWSKMPHGIKKAIAREQRPSPRDCWEMV